MPEKANAVEPHGGIGFYAKCKAGQLKLARMNRIY